MKKADIGARVTFEANISHLIAVGLIQVRQITGEHEGNEYEVRLPEEAVSMPSQSSQTSQTSHAQKVVRLGSLESSQTRHSLNESRETTSGEAKTFLKTNTENDDDEAAPQLLRTVAKLIREVTGKEATRAELEKFGEVIEVIMLEGQIAAARTTVSSAGPFLAEHLRRRLFKKDKQQLAAESAQSESSVPATDATACPECAGIGWYYPEGKEKGMAKCKHPNLSKTDAPNRQEQTEG
ncbi:MAG: hypothetical protein JO360_08475 [Acidobacteria bacterium]|nr:hypothetical protein [Acidobacteriota bacterium]